MSLIRALGSPAAARIVAKAWFVDLMRRTNCDLEAAVRLWWETWTHARFKVEIHEPELFVLGPGLSLHFGCLPASVLRAIRDDLPKFGSAHLTAKGRAVLKRYADDNAEDPQVLAHRLWTALLRSLPKSLQTRAKRACRR